MYCRDSVYKTPADKKILQLIVYEQISKDLSIKVKIIIVNHFKKLHKKRFAHGKWLKLI